MRIANIFKINLFIYYLFTFFTSMKQSLTYSGETKIKKLAMQKAKKEGVKNFSSLIDLLLKAYIAGPPLVPTVQKQPPYPTEVVDKY